MSTCKRITLKETPESKSRSPSVTQNLGTRVDDSVSLNGLSILVFIYSDLPYIHFYGIFKTSKEAMSTVNGEWEAGDLSLDKPIIGNNPKECFAAHCWFG